MFTENFYLKGRYAEIVTKLTNPVSDNNKFVFFKLNKDLLKLAPILGLIYNKKGQKESGGETKVVNVEQILSIKDDLLFAYYTIMLYSDKKNLTIEERLDKTFREISDKQKVEKNLELFDQYLFGGLIVLEEALLGGKPSETKDFIMNLSKFIDDFEIRFSNKISTDELLKIASHF